MKLETKIKLNELKNRPKRYIMDFIQEIKQNRIFKRIGVFSGKPYKIVPVDNKDIIADSIYVKGFWYVNNKDKEVDDALFVKELSDVIYKHFGDKNITVME